MDASLWSLVTVGGPILLGIVLIFVIISNRRHNSAREIERTEDATRALRDQLNAEDVEREKKANL